MQQIPVKQTYYVPALSARCSASRDEKGKQIKHTITLEELSRERHMEEICLENSTHT